MASSFHSLPYEPPNVPKQAIDDAFELLPTLPSTGCAEASPARDNALRRASPAEYSLLILLSEDLPR